MSESTIPFVCYYCGHATVNANDVMPRFEEGNGFECVSQDACNRRQKRDAILAMEPIHPVDKFSRVALAICAAFLSAIILACVFFWIGL